MSRRSFLIGHLSGLILGVLLMLAVNHRSAQPEPAIQPTIIPVSRVWDIEDMTIPLPDQPTFSPDSRRTLPEGNSFEFNGKKVYVIPLAHAERPR